MNLSIERMNLEDVYVHPAAMPAFHCFLDFNSALPLSHEIISTMAHCDRVITAHPVIFQNPEAVDFVIMNFEVFENISFDIVSFAEFENYTSSTILKVNGDLSNKDIEMISWLYVFDAYEQTIMDNSIDQIFFEHFKMQDESLLYSLFEYRPTSRFMLELQERILGWEIDKASNEN
jgi:hypothetical protein